MFGLQADGTSPETTPAPHAGRDVLAHDPWPGFKTAFAVVFAIGALYLAIVLIVSASSWSPGQTHEPTHEPTHEETGRAH